MKYPNLKFFACILNIFMILAMFSSADVYAQSTADIAGKNCLYTTRVRGIGGRFRRILTGWGRETTRTFVGRIKVYSSHQLPNCNGAKNICNFDTQNIEKRRYKCIGRFRNGRGPAQWVRICTDKFVREHVCDLRRVTCHGKDCFPRNDINIYIRRANMEQIEMGCNTVQGQFVASNRLGVEMASQLNQNPNSVPYISSDSYLNFMAADNAQLAKENMITDRTINKAAGNRNTSCPQPTSEPSPKPSAEPTPTSTVVFLPPPPTLPPTPEPKPTATTTVYPIGTPSAKPTPSLTPQPPAEY